ncbi:hypothetical protein AKO1_002296 [Acrasis kona]|uniref:Uncharacterized protein n=1 Tax=Acrasis kona TaxID=1008807 RepID=A0AAW2ZMJ5_9EUKA
MSQLKSSSPFQGDDLFSFLCCLDEGNCDVFLSSITTEQAISLIKKSSETYQSTVLERHAVFSLSRGFSDPTSTVHSIEPAHRNLSRPYQLFFDKHLSRHFENVHLLNQLIVTIPQTKKRSRTVYNYMYITHIICHSPKDVTTRLLRSAIEQLSDQKMTDFLHQVILRFPFVRDLFFSILKSEQYIHHTSTITSQLSKLNAPLAVYKLNKNTSQDSNETIVDMHAHLSNEQIQELMSKNISDNNPLMIHFPLSNSSAAVTATFMQRIMVNSDGISLLDHKYLIRRFLAKISVIQSSPRIRDISLHSHLMMGSQNLMKIARGHAMEILTSDPVLVDADQLYFVTKRHLSDDMLECVLQCWLFSFTEKCQITESRLDSEEKCKNVFSDVMLRLVQCSGRPDQPCCTLQEVDLFLTECCRHVHDASSENSILIVKLMRHFLLSLSCVDDPDRVVTVGCPISIKLLEKLDSCEIFKSSFSVGDGLSVPKIAFLFGERLALCVSNKDWVHAYYCVTLLHITIDVVFCSSPPSESDLIAREQLLVYVVSQYIQIMSKLDASVDREDLIESAVLSCMVSMVSLCVKCLMMDVHVRKKAGKLETLFSKIKEGVERVSDDPHPSHLLYSHDHLCVASLISETTPKLSRLN